MERIKVLRQININTEIFLTSFEKASKLLLEKKEELESQGWSSIHLKMDYYHDFAELNVYGMRLENDSEYNKRMKDEERKRKAAERKLERERKKYEELKKKFE